MRSTMFLALVVLTAGVAAPASAFVQDGCGAGDCRSCHSLSKNEAENILKGLVHEVLSVEFSDVPGLWVVDVEDQRGRRGPVYIDFSKRYVITGNVLEVATRENLTRRRMIDLNRIDPSRIPLDDALVIGDPAAEKKIVVFTDPDCPYCRKLHPELRKVVERRPDVAFYVKMFPIKKTSREKAKTIVCANSLELLDRAMEGREIPPPDCQTDQIEKNLEFGRSIGVRSTPTLVFPDGRVIPGAKPADKILLLLDEGAGPARKESRAGPPGAVSR